MNKTLIKYNAALLANLPVSTSRCTEYMIVRFGPLPWNISSLVPSKKNIEELFTSEILHRKWPVVLVWLIWPPHAANTQIVALTSCFSQGTNTKSSSPVKCLWEKKLLQLQIIPSAVKVYTRVFALIWILWLFRQYGSSMKINHQLLISIRWPIVTHSSKNNQ